MGLEKLVPADRRFRDNTIKPDTGEAGTGGQEQPRAPPPLFAAYGRMP